MLVYPNIDPIALALGPIRIHWYGITYLAAFALFIFLGRRHAKRLPELGWTPEKIDDMLFYGVLGVIIGGRLGEVLFYGSDYYFSDPIKILYIWQGGMSFHGGFIGVALAMLAYARKHRISFWSVADFIAPLSPTGLACGRIGNFINGELWGRSAPADLPWAMIFPHVDQIPRHPSQIYQMLGEGLLLFIILWIYTAKPRPLKAAAGLFLIGYGILRFVAEYFRHPDPGIFSSLGGGLSTAQWLCVPMMILGLVLMLLAYRGQNRVLKK